jgi:hypothetical protein
MSGGTYTQVEKYCASRFTFAHIRDRFYHVPFGRKRYIAMPGMYYSDAAENDAIK